MCVKERYGSSLVCRPFWPSVVQFSTDHMAPQTQFVEIDHHPFLVHSSDT